MIKLIKNGEVITDSQFLALYPSKSFPEQIPFEDYGWSVVFPKPQPDHNRLTHKIVPATPVLNALGKYEESWDLVALTQAEIDAEIQRQSADLTAQKSALVLRIDADADALIAQVIGQRGLEYLEAEKQAAAYITANYLGTVPPYVQDWATAKNKTATWAADDIAATATAWRSAQTSMRANRLQHKEAARNAADAAALDAVITSWSAFLVTIKTQLGIQ